MSDFCPKKARKKVDILPCLHHTGHDRPLCKMPHRDPLAVKGILGKEAAPAPHAARKPRLIGELLVVIKYIVIALFIRCVNI